MNASFKHLFDALSNEKPLIVGLMSGTSVDGLNVALCQFDTKLSNQYIKIVAFESLPFTAEFTNLVLAHRSQHEVALETLCRLNVQIAQTHAQMVNICLKKWGLSSSEITAIASHGQTIYHAPSTDFNTTLQLGDGDHLAVATGCLVWSDFRQKHIAIGGEGAPLAQYFDEEMYSSTTENRVLLNLGGIANFTWLDAKDSTRNFASDTGPANTLMDTFCQKYIAQPYDRNGEIARSGTLDKDALEVLCKHSYFAKAHPKSTGQELFNLAFVEENYARFLQAPIRDQLCTLTHFTARTIADAMRNLPTADFQIYASGGGINNIYLMELIAQYTQKEIHTLEELQFSSEAKEAALFAYLAYKAMFSTPFRMGSNFREFYMGKLSFPV